MTDEGVHMALSSADRSTGKAAFNGIWLPIAVVIALIVFFSLASDAFFSLRNMTGILGQASTLLLACLGASFVVLMGSIDLSVGAIVLLVGAVTVTALNAFGMGVDALAVSLVAGALLGLVNGVLYSLGRIPSFVVTLGTLSVFTGAAWELLQGRALRFSSPAFEELAIGQFIPHVPNIALFAIGVWVLASLAGQMTRFGRYMYIIGGGEAVARNVGIPLTRYKIYAFVISGLLAGLAGALAVARLGAAGPTLGQELLLNSLAAIVVGGTSLSGGIGGVHRTLIGVAIIALLDNGLNLMGVNQYTQMVIKGAVVVAAVLISQDRRGSIVIK
ncbi:ABC transporter permease [Taklimakanibacter deserti]|uniref:ABC transporter permease n=1 Tax=Taklimakanibacter deserti TaxID=2267839 RepID=UPI000E65258E